MNLTQGSHFHLSRIGSYWVLQYVSMVATNWNEFDLEDEFDIDEEVVNESIEFDKFEIGCDKYKRIIEKYAEYILNTNDFNGQETFDWISSGTYRMEEY